MKPETRAALMRLMNAAPDTPAPPPPQRVVQRVAAPKPQTSMNRGRMLTEGERQFYKRKFGVWPKDGMTLGEFRNDIRNARKKGGFE